MDLSQTHYWQPTLQRQCVGRSAQRTAFTIVELVMVVLVIGILAGIAIPKFGTALKSVRAHGAASWIKSDLCYAQRVAQQSSTPQSVTFDTAAESYDLPDVVDINHRGTDYPVLLNDSKFHAQLVTVDFAGSSTITFDIHGRPDNAGTIIIQSGNETETIQVNAEGQVSIL